MIIRTLVIGLLMPGIVLFGSRAGAGTLTGPKPSRTRPVYQQHITVNVYGGNNVIATDRSVLTVGDHGPVNANTGDVSSSGTLGIDADRSSLESGAAGHPTDNSESRMSGFAGQGPRAELPVPDRLLFLISALRHRRHTAISGYEDHSVRVAGEDQMAAYDDSNLFMNRNGKLNGNTGDTDSSGLNAVGVSGSTIRSGNHIEGDESEEETPGARPTARRARLPGTRPLPNGQAASTVTDEGQTSAHGPSTLTIGADGYDNLGLDVEGKRNIAAYDDSNIVAGGTGDANAQIGDSDTSGVAVMGIDNSRIQSGDST